MTYRLSHIALAALTTFGTCTAMAQVTAIAAMEGDLPSSRFVVDVTRLPAGTGEDRLWFAMLHNGQLFFDNGVSGFAPYQCPGSCDAPAYRIVSADTQQILVPGWDLRNFVGARLYVGWGRSFSEMVDRTQILEVHTVAAPSTDPWTIAYSGLYYCADSASAPGFFAKAEVGAAGANITLTQAKNQFRSNTRWYGVPVKPMESLNKVTQLPDSLQFFDAWPGVRATFMPPGNVSAKARMTLYFSGAPWVLAQYGENCEKL
ncbi:MAG: hypothetical protein V4679_14650 [Pseudomonadota bacterium]